MYGFPSVRDLTIVALMISISLGSTATLAQSTELRAQQAAEIAAAQARLAEARNTGQRRSESLFQAREELRNTQRQLRQASRSMEQLRLRRVLAAANEAQQLQNLDAGSLAATSDALREIQRQLGTVNDELSKLRLSLPDSVADAGQNRVERRVMRLDRKPRPMVGITMESRSDEDGVTLRSVTPGGPASDAGLRSGDEIIAIDGKPVDGNEGVGKAYDLLRRMDAGDSFVFSIRRDGDEQDVTVTAREMTPQIDLDLSFDAPNIISEQIIGPENWKILTPQGDRLTELTTRWPQWFDGQTNLNVTVDDTLGGLDRLIGLAIGWSGLQMVELNDDLAAYFDTDEGALVVAVSESLDADLKAGDVVTEINGEMVSNPKQAMRLLGQLKAGETVDAQLVRRGVVLAVELTAPERTSQNFFYRFETDDGE